MNFKMEQARTQSVTARERIVRSFLQAAGVGSLDAEFLDGSREAALGFVGLPFEAPICGYLLNQEVIASYLKGFSGDQLFVFREDVLSHFTKTGEKKVPQIGREHV